VLTIAYLANQFPVAVEPYVPEEIDELRRREVRVIAGSVRKCVAKQNSPTTRISDAETLYLQPVRIWTFLSALWLVATRWGKISDLFTCTTLQKCEPAARRLKALLHTCLGAYYAVLLKGKGVDHIHVHHGYFGSWIAMVAARLLEVSYSLTLHGSDLLLYAAYLKPKLQNCQFCITISDYNRRYILEHFPDVDPGRIFVSRIGVDAVPETKFFPFPSHKNAEKFVLLTVGRLHAVKDHAFLIRACARLRDCGLDFECMIAGEGPERVHLEQMILKDGLQDQLKLLGHIAHDKMNSLYRNADLVVLTSQSEGIPLVLMEAMALGKIVLAPAITGIPELVIPGKTGFLFEPGNRDSFVNRVFFLHALIHNQDQSAVNRLNWIQHAARMQIIHNFNREKNLAHLADLFLQEIPHSDRSTIHEDLVLQQI
jgi:glycosyltransferase involved in cell wall biosynthesis